LKKILFLIILVSYLFSSNITIKKEKYFYYQVLYKIEKLKIRLVKNALRFSYINPKDDKLLYLRVFLTRNYNRFVNHLNWECLKLNLSSNTRYKLADKIKSYKYYLRVRNYYAYGIKNISDFESSNDRKRYFNSFIKLIIHDIVLIQRIELKILDEIKRKKLYYDYDVKHKFFRLNIYYGEPFSQYSFYRFLNYMNRLGDTIYN
jgi:hypothetical protein